MSKKSELVRFTCGTPVQNDVMVISEASAYCSDEELTTPFPGKSGKILKKTLKECDIQEDKIFVVNFFTCEPDTERSRAYPDDFIWDVIKRVDPKAVLLLGNTALKAITGKNGGITKMEGSTYTQDGVTFIPSRSAASLVRTWGTKEGYFLEQKFRENVMLFKEQVNPSVDDFEFEICDKEFPTFPDGPVYIDYETNGLNPYRRSAKIHCLGMQSIHEDKVKVVKVSDHPRERFQEFAKKHPILCHRGTFEMMWTLRIFRVMPQLFFDTKVGAFLMNENEPTGLKYQAIKHLHVKPWAEEQDWENPNFDVMLPYMARDVAYGMRLFKEVQLPFLKKHTKMAKLAKYIIFPAEEVFTRVIHKGFHINIEAATKKLLLCYENLATLNTQINDFAGRQMNPGSPKQMTKLLYEDFGLKCPIFTKKNAPSSSEAALIRLEGKHEAIPILLEWRKWKKYASTYLSPWIYAKYPDMHQKGVLHANYGFTNTDTGRLNSTMLGNKRSEKKLGANLHQCPRDKFIRNVIDARDPEWCIVAADLSQAELRFVAHVANEPEMIRVFRNSTDKAHNEKYHNPASKHYRGEKCFDCDIHLKTAQDVLQRTEIDEETRKKAKAVNFGFVYGMWVKKFIVYAKEKFGLNLTMREGDNYREGFFDKYGGLEPWYRRVEAFVSRNGYIDSIFGRRRNLPEAQIDAGYDEWIRNRSVRQAINSPIQSAASDLNLFVAALICSEFFRDRWKYRVDREKAFCVGSAHDSLIWECHRNYTRELKWIIQSTVAELPVGKYFGFEFKVPIVMDVDAYDDCWKGKKLVI